MNNDLLNVGTHFSFGENWADFAQSVDEDRVRQAELDLTRIVGDVRGKTFLDIGCGSGIHSVAAARLGALVTAVDLDPITPFCDLWRVEKKLYTASPKPIQAVIRGGYKSAFVAGLLASGRNPIRYIRTYQNNRGMRWHHDVHDWLGGYPYESATPEEVAQFIVPRGFDLTRQAINKGPLGGLLGTGCNEYLFTRGASS